MKESHFSVGMTNENHLNPAPYKVSNPEGGMRPKPMDKNKLGRESWTLGTYPDIYKTVNQNSFNSPNASLDRQAAKDAINTLKQRVSASSIKNHVGKEVDSKTYFNTS